MTKSPLMLLLEGRQRAMFAGDKWPDCFMPWQLASLQYNPMLPDRNRFLHLVTAAMKSGELITCGMASDDFNAIVMPNMERLRDAIIKGHAPAELATWAINRESLNSWLTAIGELPSELITAWIDSAPVVTETLATPSIRKGESRNTILAAPWPELPKKRKLEKLMSDVPAWLRGAIEDEGKAPTPHTWNPAKIADALASTALHKDWTVNHALLTTFIQKHFPTYQAEWERLSEYRSNTGTS